MGGSDGRGEGVQVRRANLVGVVLDTEEEKEEESLEQSWERMQASLAAGKAQRLAVDFSIDDCLSPIPAARGSCSRPLGSGGGGWQTISMKRVAAGRGWYQAELPLQDVADDFE